jgi:hypothetical protein
MNPQRVDIQIVDTGGFFDSVSEMYQSFLDMQSSRVLLDILTGKRTYGNMLIEAIEEMTERESENMLGLNLHCRQVILAYTSSQKVSSLDTPVNQGFQQPFDSVKLGNSVAGIKSIPGINPELITPSLNSAAGL